MHLLTNHPMVTTEQWENFTETDHTTWKILFERQSTLLSDRAAPEVIQGMQTLSICSSSIPKFSELNIILKRETDFSIVPVKGFIPEELFFRFLSERKFPATCFIRKPEQLDYLEEPDIFHDIFGHVPLLVNPTFANFMQAFGIKGLEALQYGMLELAATLYWFTIEFGLITNKTGGLQIYGAGILSSKSESLYSLDSTIPKRIPFNLERVMNTNYHIDSLQTTYFFIESFEELFNTLYNLDWSKIRKKHFLSTEIKGGEIMSNMCSLTDKNCIPCQGGTPPLGIEEAQLLMKELQNNWTINEKGHLYKPFKFKNFMDAMDFANKIATLSEQQGHHPDLGISWGACQVEIWTHKINGLTESDFILAAKIEAIQ